MRDVKLLYQDLGEMNPLKIRGFPDEYLTRYAAPVCREANRLPDLHTCRDVIVLCVVPKIVYRRYKATAVAVSLWDSLSMHRIGL